MSFRISRLASLSGFDAGLIRAWERRYGLLSPQRLDNGYRAYTSDDLLVLTRVRKLLDEGHSIGDIARRGRARLLEEARPKQAPPREATVDAPIDDTRSLAWQVLDALPCAVIVTDPGGRVSWVNRGVLSLCGYDLAEMYGRTPGSVLQGPDTDPEAVARLREAVAGQRPCSVAIVNYDKQGRPYTAQLDVAPLGVGAAHRGFVGLARKIDVPPPSEPVSRRRDAR